MKKYLQNSPEVPKANLCWKYLLSPVNITYHCVCVSHWVMSDSLQPLDCSSPGSSVHGIVQARILEWVAVFFSRGSSRPRGQTCVSCPGRRVLYHWATKEDPQWLITVSKTSPKGMQNASNFIMFDDSGSQESRWSTVEESVSALWASGQLRPQLWCFNGWALGWPGRFFHQMSSAPGHVKASLRWRSQPEHPHMTSQCAWTSHSLGVWFWGWGQTFQEIQAKLHGLCLPIFGIHVTSLQPRPVLTVQLRFKARDDFSPISLSETSKITLHYNTW